jgi:mannose-6-phosphate isomerase-like protein (cupin superfamily)
MGAQSINLRSKFEQITQLWSPRVIAELNDYQFKLVRLQGEFIWHEHPDTDEAFLVLEGRLRIDLDAESVELGAGELYVVAKGRRHKPSALEETKVLLIEPKGVLNTGSEGGPRTVQNDQWI